MTSKVMQEEQRKWYETPPMNPPIRAPPAQPTFPPIVAAVEAHATVGEIADAMRAVFGEFEGTSAP